mmetsp:Transcript_28612/g.101363  ORF Transcript_28612/g.101363 Transcript_28612/m.101363 type:complete len:490 (+) Transcript_28612:929-2398(+)
MLQVEPVGALSPSTLARLRERRSLTGCSTVRLGNASDDVAAMAIFLEAAHARNSLVSLPLLRSLLLPAPVAQGDGVPRRARPGGSGSFRLVGVSAGALRALHESACAGLNGDQNAVVAHVAQWFAARPDAAATARPPSRGDVELVHGVFGAGKSHTLARIIQFVDAVRTAEKTATGRRSDLRILLTAATNVAVDRVLLTLLESGVAPRKVLRVGSIKAVDARLARHLLHADGSVAAAARDLDSMLQSAARGDHETRGHLEAARDDIKRHATADYQSQCRQRLQHAVVVGVTCHSSGRDILAGQRFSIAILDEASQCTDPLSLVALVNARAAKALLVGDPKQLPPLLAHAAATCADSLQTSLFVRLQRAGLEATVLKTQRVWRRAPGRRAMRRVGTAATRPSRQSRRGSSTAALWSTASRLATARPSSWARRPLCSSTPAARSRSAATAMSTPQRPRRPSPACAASPAASPASASSAATSGKSGNFAAPR